MNKKKLINLPTFKENRGNLTVLEKELKFPIERIFWIYDSDFQTRGGHRHIKTKQGLISIAGTIKISIENKEGCADYILNDRSKCLIIEPEDWHEMEFSKNSVLLVVASTVFDKNDYLYSKF